jgi:hypothetical protein
MYTSSIDTNELNILESRGPLYSFETSPFRNIFKVGYPETPNLLHVSLPASVQSTYNQ